MAEISSDRLGHFFGGYDLAQATRDQLRSRLDPVVASRSQTGCGAGTVPIFLLVSQVKLRKRLDLARDAERAASQLPGMIVANWVEGRI